MKNAVITGAARGIGKAIAHYFASKKYNLLLIDILNTELEATVEEIVQKYQIVAKYSCFNVSNHKLTRKSIREFVDSLGPIDVLVNNAGYIKRGTSDLDYEQFMQMLESNLIGTFNFVHCVTPYMKENHSGYILNIASQSGKRSRPFLGGYAASKSGLIAFNDSLYQELAPYGICVTAICPGFVATDMTSDVTDIKQNEMVQPEDIVKTIDFLLSLPPLTVIKEIIIECRKQIGRKETFKPIVKK